MYNHLTLQMYDPTFAASADYVGCDICEILFNCIFAYSPWINYLCIKKMRKTKQNGHQRTDTVCG